MTTPIEQELLPDALTHPTLHPRAGGVPHGSETSTEDEVPGPRIGRWEVGPGGAVSLLGSRCRTCGETIFPERANCPRCRSEDLEPARIDGPAKLLSWTVVHQAPSGFTVPMAVGYAVLPGDVVVLAPIDAPPEMLAKGLELRVTEGQTSVAADGTPLVSYRFASGVESAHA